MSAGDKSTQNSGPKTQVLDNSHVRSPRILFDVPNPFSAKTVEPVLLELQRRSAAVGVTGGNQAPGSESEFVSAYPHNSRGSSSPDETLVSANGTPSSSRTKGLSGTAGGPCACDYPRQRGKGLRGASVMPPPRQRLRARREYDDVSSLTTDQAVPLQRLQGVHGVARRAPSVHYLAVRHIVETLEVRDVEGAHCLDCQPEGGIAGLILHSQMVPGCAQCAKNPCPVKALTIAVVAETHGCPM